MARTTDVQYEAVAAACLALFQDGDSPTFAKVYAALGNRGSGKVVNEMIRRWRKDLGDRLSILSQRSLPGVPDALVATVDALVAQTWQLAIDEGEAAYQVARERLAEEREAWQHKLDAAVVLEGDLKALRATLVERDKALAEIQVLRAEDLVVARERDAQLLAQREGNARLLATIGAEQQRHAAELAAQQDRHSAEILLERERADGERRHFAHITDELRQAAKAREHDLAEQLDGYKESAERYRAQAGKFSAEAAGWRARAETAEAALEKDKANRVKDERRVGKLLPMGSRGLSRRR
jgi:hypothetical protein